MPHNDKNRTKLEGKTNNFTFLEKKMDSKFHEDPNDVHTKCDCCKGEFDNQGWCSNYCFCVNNSTDEHCSCGRKNKNYTGQGQN